MNYGLNIKTAGGLDFVSLGALVHRLDPGIIPFRKATECRIHVGLTGELVPLKVTAFETHGFTTRHQKVQR